MSAKVLVMLGLTIGSVVGSYIPVLFGASAFSFMSIFWGAIGSIIGIYIGYRLSESY